MSTIIVYMTKHGATEKNINILKEKLNDDTIDVCNLKTAKCDISKYDNIVVGGSIHAGQLQGKIKKFCAANETNLLNKKLGIFITCMEESETKQNFVQKNFPEKLLNHATAVGIFGGEFNFDRMNFLEKFIIKKITGETSSKSRINETDIIEFVEKFNG